MMYIVIFILGIVIGVVAVTMFGKNNKNKLEKLRASIQANYDKIPEDVRKNTEDFFN